MVACSARERCLMHGTRGCATSESLSCPRESAMLFCAKHLTFCGTRVKMHRKGADDAEAGSSATSAVNPVRTPMRRIAIQLDFAGGYGRGVLRGVMQYANLRTDWEFVMPPMYSLGSKRLDELETADGVIAMLHAARSVEPFRRNAIPVVNTARPIS